MLPEPDVWCALLQPAASHHGGRVWPHTPGSQLLLSPGEGPSACHVTVGSATAPGQQQVLQLAAALGDTPHSWCSGKRGCCSQRQQCIHETPALAVMCFRTCDDKSIALQCSRLCHQCCVACACAAVCLPQLAPACGSYLLATWLTGHLYDKAAQAGGDIHACTGHDCFGPAFRILTAGSAVSTCFCVYAAVRSRGVYRLVAGHLQHARGTAAQAEAADV
jgi:hypothetical protein